MEKDQEDLNLKEKFYRVIKDNPSMIISFNVQSKIVRHTYLQLVRVNFREENLGEYTFVDLVVRVVV